MRLAKDIHLCSYSSSTICWPLKYFPQEAQFPPGLWLRQALWPCAIALHGKLTSSRLPGGSTTIRLALWTLNFELDFDLHISFRYQKQPQRENTWQLGASWLEVPNTVCSGLIPRPSWLLNWEWDWMIVHVGAYNPSCYLFRKEELSSTLSALIGVWISLQGNIYLLLNLLWKCPFLPHVPPLVLLFFFQFLHLSFLTFLL